MWQTYLSTWRRFISCKGRSNRREYWIWQIFNFIIYLFGLMVFGTEGMEGMVGTVVGLTVLLPSTALAARRLHDMNMSGWWLLLYFVPIVNIILMLRIMFWSGTMGENRFGPEPQLIF